MSGAFSRALSSMGDAREPGWGPDRWWAAWEKRSALGQT